MADATISKAAIEKIVLALGHRRTVSYPDVSAATLLIYDVVINLPVEIEHVWMRNWSTFDVLYILQRYLPFFDTMGLVLHHHFGENLSTRYCTLNYNMTGWSFVVGLMLSEIILTFRIWAVWKSSVPVGIGLVVFFLICWAPLYFVLIRFLNTMEFTTLPLSSFRGCFIASGSDILYLCWVLLAVFNTGTLAMILGYGVVAYRRGGRSELVKVVYRDGVMYYASIFLISMINVIVILTLPPDFVDLLSSFERALHSLLTSRAILHIRHVGGSQHSDDYYSINLLY